MALDLTEQKINEALNSADTLFDLKTPEHLSAGSNNEINKTLSLKMANAIRKLEDKTLDDNFVCLTGYGDSMAVVNGYVIGNISRALQLRYGLGAMFSSLFGDSGIGQSWNFGGGATQPNDDFTYLPSACQINMPVNSTASTVTNYVGTTGDLKTEGSFPEVYDQRDAGSDTVNFTKVRFYYLTRPSDGDLEFNVTQDGGTYSAVNVDCDAALGLAYSEITVTNQALPVGINITCTNAACIFIGAVFFRESGIMALSSQVGGTTMTQQNVYIDNGNDVLIYKTLCDSLEVKLIIHAQRAGDDVAYIANYTKVFNSLDANINADQLVLGEAPREDTVVVNVPTMNAHLLSESITRGYTFFDQSKAVGSLAKINAVGWYGNDVHLQAPAHRYLGAKILDALDYFRFGGNHLDADPLSMSNLLDRMVSIQQAVLARSSSITARAQSTVDGGSTSGSGFSFVSSNQKGFEFRGGGSGLGHSSGSIGSVSLGLKVDTRAASFSTTLTGYRNMQLRTGVRAFFAVGVDSVVSSPANLTERCYGFECALGSDVGNPTGNASEVMRLFTFDGTTLVYGPWVQAINPGAGSTSQGGLNVTIAWNLAKSRFELFTASSPSYGIASTLASTYFLTNETWRDEIIMGVFAEDGAEVPTESASFSVREVKTFSTMNARGITGNNI